MTTKKNVSLKEIIHSLAERIDEAERRLTFQQQLERAAKYLVNYSTYVPQFSTATVIFKILLQLMSFAKDDSALKKHAVKVVDRIISTSWVDWRENKVNITCLFFFLKKKMHANSILFRKRSLSFWSKA
jgi:hypothetical protein